MKRINRNGSAILLVVLITTIVLLICLSSWRSTTYIFDIALQRGMYQKKSELTKALLNYGILYGKEQFDFLISNTHNKTVSIPFWPNKKSVYAGHLSIECSDNKHIKVIAKLAKEGVIVDQMLCTLHRDAGENNRFIISQFCYV